jgi:hypothetical protein
MRLGGAEASSIRLRFPFTLGHRPPASAKVPCHPGSAARRVAHMVSMCPRCGSTDRLEAVSAIGLPSATWSGGESAWWLSRAGEAVAEQVANLAQEGCRAGRVSTALGTAPTCHAAAEKVAAVFVGPGMLHGSSQRAPTAFVDSSAYGVQEGDLGHQACSEARPCATCGLITDP